MIFIFSVNGIECSSSLFLEKILILNFCYYCFCFITIFKANGCSNCSPLLLAGNNWIVLLNSSFTFFVPGRVTKSPHRENMKRIAAKKWKVWNIGALIETWLPLSAIYWGYITHTRFSYFIPPLKYSMRRPQKVLLFAKHKET